MFKCKSLYLSLNQQVRTWSVFVCFVFLRIVSWLQHSPQKWDIRLQLPFQQNAKPLGYKLVYLGVFSTSPVKTMNSRFVWPEIEYMQEPHTIF